MRKIAVLGLLGCALLGVDTPPVAGAGEVACSAEPCSRALQGSTRLRTWVSPSFPASYGWRFSVFREGHELKSVNSIGECSGTFGGRGMLATLNGCRRRLKLLYLGAVPFTIRWRVFAHCACGQRPFP